MSSLRKYSRLNFYAVKKEISSLKLKEFRLRSIVVVYVIFFCRVAYDHKILNRCNALVLFPTKVCRLYLEKCVKS